MVKKSKPANGFKPDHALQIDQYPSETGAQSLARKLLEPHFRHAVTASAYVGVKLDGLGEGPGTMDFATYVHSSTVKVGGGDLAIASRLLVSQAITLDCMFTEFSRRSALNMGEFVNAAERYGRLALKAQSNCRATLEALAKLHLPHEQVVRHVHVNEGGKAVIADQFHHHARGVKNDDSIKQSHATGPTVTSTTLPSPDASGDGVLIPDCEGQAAMQDAWRYKSRRA